MLGTLRVDVDALTVLLQQLLSVKLVLEGEKSLMSLLITQLDAAITGTGNAGQTIANYDKTFSGWATLLGTVTTDIESAYSTLNTVLTDTLNAVQAL